MALRAYLRRDLISLGGFRRGGHAIAPSAPLHSSFETAPPPMVFPEHENDDCDGYMELMAVPKKKTSPHKKGIRNGPKALKPVPVIVRCTVCGRVKLPHFFCCSGIKPNPGGESS